MKNIAQNKNKINKYIFFTYDGCSLSIARKLEEEGNTVIVAQIQDAKELHGDKKEDAEKKKKRLSIFDGLIVKHDAKDVIKKMKNMPNKDEWFVVFDMNSLWYYSEIVNKLGFKNGFFPTHEDTLLEDDRNSAKEFVKKYYKELKVADVHEFKTIDEGIDFLNETEEDMFVLKSNDESGATVCPASDDPVLAREEIIGALQLEKANYEKAGFILELRIIDPVEITPEIVFYNGEVVMTTIDIENKPIGSGSVGPMTGCAGNLIIKTDLKEKINTMAFPQIVYDMAKKHDGLFVWDASMLIESKSKKIYFGEFCSNRWGWDSILTELAMCDSVSSFFENIVEGKNPLTKDFGIAVRMFNLKEHGDIPVVFKDSEDDIYMYDVKLNKDKIVSVGCEWSLLISTGGDNDINKAVEKCYNTLKGVSFSNGYYRPKFDFVSSDYQNSVMNRYEFTNHWLYNTQDFDRPENDSTESISKMTSLQKESTGMIEKISKQKDKEISLIKERHTNQIKDLETKYNQEIDSIKEEISNILKNE